MVTDSIYEPFRKANLAIFQKKLSPSAKLPFYGISIPSLRLIAKTVLFEDITITYHEDVILKGLALGLEMSPFENKIKRLNSLLPHLSSWDHTDTIVTNFKAKDSDKDAMFKYFSSLLESKETFTKRLGIVWLMSNRNEVDYYKALDLIVSADDGNDYYVMMAVSWALSFYALDGKDISNELEKVSANTKKMTERKIKESKRSSKNMNIETFKL